MPVAQNSSREHELGLIDTGPQPVFLRTTHAIAAISFLEAVVPAALVVSSLAGLAYVQDAAFSGPLAGLGLLACYLSLVMLKPLRNGSLGTLLGPVAIGMNLLARWVALLAILLAIGYVAGISGELPRRVVLPWAIIAPSLVFAAALALKIVMRRAALSRANVRTAVVVGANEPSLSLAERIVAFPELGICLEGFFDDRRDGRIGDLSGHRRLGMIADLKHYLELHQIDVVFIALPLRDTTASIYHVPDVFVIDLVQSRTADVYGIPVIAMRETPFYGYRGVIKRLVDLSVATLLIVTTLPLMVAIFLAVKVTTTGPPIFKQRRYGLDGKEITVYKFRSMTVAEDGPEMAQAKKDDARITGLGRWLRRYSLDELPQLFNVLGGTMSLVGPRPHAVAHNEQYRRVIKGYMIRHKVLPGITGLAQINGCRGETAEVEQMQTRVNYDLEYLRRWSPLLDAKILILTVFRIFRDAKAY
jgi:putative colanic acid biosynthesis UDP-glucose lipid carrier transferase